MPTFCLMTRLASDASKDAVGRRRMGKDWMDHVKSACPGVKWIAHYSLLGPYDFLDIYEAADVETAHRVALISRGEGALGAETWPALPYESFLNVLEEVNP